MIELSSIDSNRKLRIRIIAEILAKESKLRLFLYTDDGFIGSMAEAEGVLK